VNGPHYNELLALVGRGLMVRTDSRLVQPGEVFALMPSAADKAADFLADALARGAGWLVLDQNTPVPGDTAAGLVRVDDTASTLGTLAEAHFHTREQAMQVVGITGTNGKTTVAYLLEGLLSACGRTVGVLGTVAYRWPGTSIDASLTTPGCWRLHELFAQMSADGVDTVIMETSSHALHQKRVAGLEFDAAVLTNLTQDHLDYHGDFENYYQAKRLLFSSYPRPDKHMAANADDPYGQRLLKEFPDALGFTLQGAATCDKSMLCGKLVECSSRGLLLRMEWEGKCWSLNSGLVGQHNASNLLAAQAAALGLGMGPADMQPLAPFTGVPGRLERVENAHGLDVFVDYAHTPDALLNVQRALLNAGFKRLVTVFGCGGNRDRAKRPLMGQAVAELSDICVLTSDNPRHEDPLAIIDDVRPGLAKAKAVIEDADRYQAMLKAVAQLKKGDALLIAGKGHESYQQVGDVKHPFSDVAAAKRAIAEVLG